jgi:DNA-binding protein Fis
MNLNNHMRKKIGAGGEPAPQGRFSSREVSLDRLTVAKYGIHDPRLVIIAGIYRIVYETLEEMIMDQKLAAKVSVEIAKTAYVLIIVHRKEAELKAILERYLGPELIDVFFSKVDALVDQELPDYTDEDINLVLSYRGRRQSKEELEMLLEEYNGNVTKISRLLGVNRVTLYAWLDTCDLDAKNFR